MEPSSQDQSRILIGNAKDSVRSAIAFMANNGANSNALVPAVKALELLELSEAGLRVPTTNEQMNDMESLVQKFMRQC